MPFPNSLDTTSTIPVETSTTPLSTNHVTNHTAMQTAIIAIETLLGITGSAVNGAFNYILGEITGSDKAVGKSATQTMTNKTLTSPVINVGSDATGDIYYRNAGGLFTRLPVGTNNHVLNLTAGIPAWRAETSTTNASTTANGTVEAATSAEVTAGTATGATGAVLAVTPDALAASTPVFDGSGLTNLPSGSISSVATAVTQAGTGAGAESTTNVDTTITTTFLPKAITIYYKLKGYDSASSDFFSYGVATFDGTTMRSNSSWSQNSDTSAFTPTFSATAPTAGTYSGGSGNSNQVTITVNSVSSTNLVVRCQFHAWGTGTTATADFSVVAVR